jgi:hypothetical protein
VIWSAAPCGPETCIRLRAGGEVLEPVIARYRGKVKRLYFRGDAAFANSEMYELLEAEAVGDPAVGQPGVAGQNRPPAQASGGATAAGDAPFLFQLQLGRLMEQAATSGGQGRVAPRRALSPRRLHRHQPPAERVVAFYNHRGTREQYIKEGKGAVKWPRLSCRSFAANAVRLQLHALAYNLGNFMRTLAMPKTAEPWSLTSLRDNLIKIGAKVVSHGRYVTFQMAEVAVPRQMFREILPLIARLRALLAPA